MSKREESVTDKGLLYLFVIACSLYSHHRAGMTVLTVLSVLGHKWTLSLREL